MSFLSELTKFSRTVLKSVETKVTRSDGKTLTEHKDQSGNIISNASGYGYGYVQDFTPDLLIGRVLPWLYISSQDVAQDLLLLNDEKITHIINLASGVPNTFPDKFIYKSIEIRDLPESNIQQHFDECLQFIDEAKDLSGIVLVHCNAGVSRASSITIAYVMYHLKMSFTDAFEMVKSKRECIRPNIGFTNQLKDFEKIIMKN